MPTTHVTVDSESLLQDIAHALWKAKKVVVITGAGISTNSGIPVSESAASLHFMPWYLIDSSPGFSIRKWAVFLDPGPIRRGRDESCVGRAVK